MQPHKRIQETPISAAEFLLTSLPAYGGVPCTRETLRFPSMDTTGPEREQKIMSAPHVLTTVPKKKLSSTRSAASNFQSFPHPLHSSPRKAPQSNNGSGGWVAILANTQSEVGRGPGRLRCLLGIVVKLCNNAVNPFLHLVIIKIWWRDISKECMKGENLLGILSFLSSHLKIA